MSSHVDTFLARLVRVSKRQSGGWMACCPVHDDETPSLSVDLNDKGDVLVKCFGCDATADQITKAVGLGVQALFASPNGSTSHEPSRPVKVSKPKVAKPGVRHLDRIHRYANADGTVTHAVYVHKNNGDKWCQPWTKTDDGMVRNEWEGPRFLYKLPELLSTAGGVRVFLEGEKDVDTALGFGIVGATTNPFGSNSVTHPDLDLSPLYDSEMVVVVGDDDPAGDKFGQTLAQHLTEHAVPVKVVDLGTGIDGGDFTDWVEAGGTLDDWDRLVTETARWQPDTVDIAEAGLPQPLDWTADTDDDPNDRHLVEPVLQRRRRTTLFAPAGEGKSLFVMWLALQTALGEKRLLTEAGDPQHVVYIDAEMTPDDAYDRVEDMGIDRKTNETLQEYFHYFQHPDIETLDTHEGARQALEMVNRWDTVLVVVDTVTSLVSGNENEAGPYREYGKRFAAKLVAQGIAVVTVDHAGKDPDRGQRGSSGKNDIQDVTWQLSKPDTSPSTLHLKRRKGRQSSVPERVFLTIEDDPLSYTMQRLALTHQAHLLVKEMDRLGIPTNYGRDKVTQRLKEAGVDTPRTVHISEAIRHRKQHPESREQSLEQVTDDTTGTGAGTGASPNPQEPLNEGREQVPGTGGNRSRTPYGNSSLPLRGNSSQEQFPKTPCPSCGKPLTDPGGENGTICSNQKGSCVYFGWPQKNREDRESR